MLRVCLSFCLFALGFILSPCLSAFRLSSSICPLCLPCLFLCPCGFCRCFLFPCGIYAKRKGAIPCVLSCPAVSCFIWLLLCIPRTRQVSARLCRNKVLEKGNLIECSKLFCARLCSYLCSSKFVFLLFSYLGLLVGSYFLSSFRLSSLYSVSLSSVCQYSWSQCVLLFRISSISLFCAFSFVEKTPTHSVLLSCPISAVCIRR